MALSPLAQSRWARPVVCSLVGAAACRRAPPASNTVDPHMTRLPAAKASSRPAGGSAAAHQHARAGRQQGPGSHLSRAFARRHAPLGGRCTTLAGRSAPGLAPRPPPSPGAARARHGPERFHAVRRLGARARERRGRRAAARGGRDQCQPDYAGARDRGAGGAAAARAGRAPPRALPRLAPHLPTAGAQGVH